MRENENIYIRTHIYVWACGFHSWKEKFIANQKKDEKKKEIFEKKVFQK